MRTTNAIAVRHECSPRNTSTPLAASVKCLRCAEPEMDKLIVIQDIVWDGTISRGGHMMWGLQWLHGLERLGYEVLFLA